MPYRHHDMKEFDINLFFDTYTHASTKERKAFLERLRHAGINIQKIECYTYPEARGIKHVFFHFQGKEEPVPYFLVEKDILKMSFELL